MEHILRKVRITRPVCVSGKPFQPGAYTIGQDLSKADAVALIQMRKAVPLVSGGVQVEHREVEVMTREPEMGPELKTSDQFPEDEKIAEAEKVVSKKRPYKRKGK